MKKNKRSFPVKSTLLFAAAGILMLGSAVGSTRAALTYYSENYSAQMNMLSIGVTLQENGKDISSRDYQQNGSWAENSGILLKNLIPAGEKFTPGKAYDEKLSVKNSGSIDTFVRMIVTKSWKKDDIKDTTLDPNLIELNLTEGSGWTQAPVEGSDERSIYYYTNAIPAGESSNPLTDSIRIDGKIAKEVVKKQEGNIITYEYAYNGYTFCLEAEVDAVQTHNAAEAIKSAWGVDVAVADDELSYRLQ